jgi:hypothetical protein
MSKAVCFSLVLALALLGFTQQAQAARLVKIRVYVGEVVILEGSTSDDGSPDADRTWNYLREVHLKPTNDFEKHVDMMAIKDDSLELNTSGKITVAYGGRKEFRKAVFTKSTDGKGAVQYRLETELIEKWFDSRLITRREAASLKSPKLE